MKVTTLPNGDTKITLKNGVDLDQAVAELLIRTKDTQGAIEVGGRLSRQRFTQEFLSLPAATVTIPAIAADLALPNVVIAGLPSGATITRVTAELIFRAVENTNAGANALTGAQKVQVKENAAGAFIDAINFADNQFTFAAIGIVPGGVQRGILDVKAQVAGNGTYAFKWLLALADAAAIVLEDVQVGLFVEFSI
jgi:hypothetical protein